MLLLLVALGGVENDRSFFEPLWVSHFRHLFYLSLDVPVLFLDRFSKEELFTCSKECSRSTVELMHDLRGVISLGVLPLHREC